MNKIYGYIYKIALTISGGGMAYCFAMSVFGKMGVYDYEPFILLIGIPVYIGIVGLLYRQCRKLTDRHLNLMVVVMPALYLILALIFGLGIKSERPADIFKLHNAAVSYLRTGKISDINYFSVYPIQLVQTYTLIAVYKLGSMVGIEDYRTSGTLFGVALLFLSAVLLYRIAEKIKDKYLGVCSLFVFVTNPVFWIYPSYYYTDLTGMVFLLLTINIALCINANSRKKTNLLLCFLMGIAVFAGYKFRATAAIGGIAVLALSIVKLSNSKEKIYIGYPVAFCLGCIIALAGYKMVDNYFGIVLDKEKQFPIVHWIMMGLSEESGGRWSGELWSYTNSFPTYSEKISADIEAIKHSLSDMGVLGTTKLMFSKLIIMWSDGMTALTANFRTSVHYGTLYEYTIGNRNAAVCYGTQIMRGSLLLCAIPYLFSEMKNKFSRKSIPAVAFFGYMLFYCFWEVHEKYVLMFLPVLIIMAVYGLGILMETLSDFRELTITGTGVYILDKMKLLNVLKKGYLLISIFTIVLYVLCWDNMVVKTEKKYNNIVFQSSASGSIRIGNNAVKQTFSANAKLNAVYVRFLNNDVPKEQEYVFSLYDENDSCVYQEIFTANDIGNDTYHAFCFEEIQVSGYHEFYFEIEAIAEYENTLEICSAGNNDSDYYSRGKCTVADEDKGDMTFRVYYIETVGYYPKAFYITMGLMILLLEAVIYTSDAVNIQRRLDKKG